ncbi:hypothetical protein Bca52824_066453 [Brassica carinata]|uniref:Uncharacterized protein n=1 Tax=Brassica carinata TaxID=52824 RepID=A0A8X7QL15_BRACI|nr:hypothetical protein Bca52824_066453 [Brassica carinata]
MEVDDITMHTGYKGGLETKFSENSLLVAKSSGNDHVAASTTDKAVAKLPNAPIKVWCFDCYDSREGAWNHELDSLTQVDLNNCEVSLLSF